MEISLDPNATLAVQMDLPSIVRNDTTGISQMIARYRGVKLTLLANGAAPDSEALKLLDGLEQQLVAVRSTLPTIVGALSAPGPADLAGGSVEELEEEVDREKQAAKADAARAKYGKKPKARQ